MAEAQALQTVQAPSLLAKVAARFSVEPSKLMTTLKATAFRVKDGEASNEQMMALLVVADQYKLNPFTKEIYAYPDKQNGIVPVVSVDGWTRIVNEHPEFDGVEFEYGPPVPAGTLPGQRFPAHEWVTTKIYRKDRSHPISLTEYLDEVYRAPFEGTDRNGKTYSKEGPWQSHTKRLHRHKSWIQCARLAFGFAGIYDEDEAQRIVNVTESAQVVERQPLTAQVQRASVRGTTAEQDRRHPDLKNEPGYTLAEVIAIANDATDDDGIAYARSLLSSLSEADAEKAREAIDQRAADLTQQG